VPRGRAPYSPPLGGDLRIWHYGLVARWWAEFNEGGGDVDYFRRAIESGGEPALDPGCGTGRLLIPFRQAGLNVDGSDASRHGLPLLEAMRRKTNFENFHSYVDDFVVGALLLYAARAVTRERANGPVMLVVAWALFCGGLNGSFFWQLSSNATQDVGGLANMTVVVIKGFLYAIALAGLFFSSRFAISKQGAV